MMREPGAALTDARFRFWARHTLSAISTAAANRLARENFESIIFETSQPWQSTQQSLIRPRARRCTRGASNKDARRTNQAVFRKRVDAGIIAELVRRNRRIRESARAEMPLRLG